MPIQDFFMLSQLTIQQYLWHNDDRYGLLLAYISLIHTDMHKTAADNKALK